MTTLCASVRRKGSTEACGCRALLGHTLCGTHARAKTVTLWTDANKGKVIAIQRIQAVARGWMVRARLRLAGPGVLRRTGLCNEEDLETCESASRQSPLDYFAFTENGKIWWFEFETLWKWARMSVEPTNPYTKVPLDTETKKRLRRMWSARRRHRMPVPAEPSVYQDRIRQRWTIVCQLFADNGFGTIDPGPFTRLTKNDYILLFRRLRDILQGSVPPHQNRHALLFIHQCLIAAWTLPPTQFILQTSYAIVAMLLHAKDEFSIAFCLLSALYSL
jgi:hypothetical protein